VKVPAETEYTRPVPVHCVSAKPELTRHSI